jgi:hypothetical protein
VQEMNKLSSTENFFIPSQWKYQEWVLNKMLALATCHIELFAEDKQLTLADHPCDGEWEIGTMDEAESAMGPFENWMWVLTVMRKPASSEDFWTQIKDAVKKGFLYEEETDRAKVILCETKWLAPSK